MSLWDCNAAVLGAHLARVVEVGVLTVEDLCRAWSHPRPNGMTQFEVFFGFCEGGKLDGEESTERLVEWWLSVRGG